MRRPIRSLLLGVPAFVLACTYGTEAPAVAHGRDAACPDCHSAELHRWRGTLHAASAAAVLTNVEHNSTEQLTNECIQCHAPFQAGVIDVGSFVQPLNMTGPWTALPNPAWEAIKCQTCHDPQSTAKNLLAFYDPIQHSYVGVKSTTDLCEKCHQAGTDDSRDLAGSVHASLQCTDCHFQQGMEMSLDPTGVCAKCHPAVMPNHPDVTTLETTYYRKDSPNNIHFITCASCHSWAAPDKVGAGKF